MRDQTQKSQLRFWDETKKSNKFWLSTLDETQGYPDETPFCMVSYSLCSLVLSCISANLNPFGLVKVQFLCFLRPTLSPSLDSTGLGKSRLVSPNGYRDFLWNIFRLDPNSKLSLISKLCRDQNGSRCYCLFPIQNFYLLCRE